MKIKIDYDKGNMHVDIKENVSTLPELIETCVFIVGCMTKVAKINYGEKAMGAMLQAIRNVDDAGGYTLLGMIEDGEADEDAERMDPGSAGMGRNCGAGPD